MQRLALEPCQALGEWGAPEFLAIPSIVRITKQRMPQSGHMHADLMRTAGPGLELNERVAPETLQDAKLGDGFAPCAGVRRHLLSIHRMPSHRSIDHPFCVRHLAARDGHISLLDATLGELARQPTMGDIVLGDNYGPGGVFIQAVHNSRTLDASDPR